jgi:hypothetical protein
LFDCDTGSKQPLRPKLRRCRNTDCFADFSSVGRASAYTDFSSVEEHPIHTHIKLS